MIRAGVANRSTPRAEPAGSTVRVAFFSDAFPERNGTGAYYHDLLLQLGARVEALRVFQPSTDERPFFSIPMPGDSAQRLETPPVSRIRRQCNDLRPNVIVVVTPGLYGLLGVWEARRHGATLVSAFHTDFEQLARMYWNAFSRFFVNLVLRTANGIVVGASSCVLINNERLKPDVEKLGAKRVEVIGTPLPAEFIARPEVPISDHLTRVCFAGRLAPEKNVDQILAAARELPHIEFAIGGDGPLRGELERAARDLPNVRFTGWLSRSALIDHIDGASLLILPSAFETFGSIALESMARGRPALVSSRAGIQAWPELRPGLFELAATDTVASRIRQLEALGPLDWRAKSESARSAARALNEHTVDHWSALLQRRVPPALERS